MAFIMLRSIFDFLATILNMFYVSTIKMTHVNMSWLKNINVESNIAIGKAIRIHLRENILRNS